MEENTGMISSDMLYSQMIRLAIKLGPVGMIGVSSTEDTEVCVHIEMRRRHNTYNKVMTVTCMTRLIKSPPNLNQALYISAIVKT